MEDSNETLLELQNRQKNEVYARNRLLGGESLKLDENSIHWILNHVVIFVSQSKGNESVKQVYLRPYACNGQNDDVWDKVGQAIGNLQALELIVISPYNDHEDEVVPIPDWEILARILSHVPQKVGVRIDDFYDVWAVGEVQALARAIRGHPTITSFDCCYTLPYESMNSLYSALVTLPALESVNLSNRRLHTPEDESALANPESLTELLGVPSLRTVRFDRFSFTPALCQAAASAFMEGTTFTNLEFSECSFSAGECAAILANGLSRNTSVSYIKVVSNVVSTLDQTLCSALTTTLPSNSTLRELSYGIHRSLGETTAHVDWAPFFSALGKNTGLKTLRILMTCAIDESLCTAIQNGLETNETLESLNLGIPLRDDNVDLWCRAFSFLRTNKALKFLVVDFQDDVKESCISAFRFDIAATLQENVSLESLSVQSWDSGFDIKAEEYLALVTALQHQNTRLKSLKFHCHFTTTIRLTDNEDKQMAALLKKSCALESFGIDLENEARDVGAILRLNKAGRRYLVQDGSSISKGVKVLSKVNNDVNCVFLHLLENPRLCDRSAVEMGTGGESNSGRSPDPTASGGGEKREQASAHTSKKSYRRLA
jgi:hypothetical protein